MIRSGYILMIKDSAKKGKIAYAISKELHISKNTAKKYMEQPTRAHGLKGTHKGSKLDPYKPQLQAWMNQGIFMGRELQTMNQQNKLALWAERISACRDSGQGVKAWCQEHGVCEVTFYKWQ